MAPSCLSSFVPFALGRRTFSSAAVVWPESAGGSTQACPCPSPPCSPRPRLQCGWALHNPGCACLAIEAYGRSGECPWLLTPSEESDGGAAAPGSLCVSHGAVCGQAGGPELAPPRTHVSDLGPASSVFPRTNEHHAGQWAAGGWEGQRIGAPDSAPRRAAHSGLVHPQGHTRDTGTSRMALVSCHPIPRPGQPCCARREQGMSRARHSCLKEAPGKGAHSSRVSTGQVGAHVHT